MLTGTSTSVPIIDAHVHLWSPLTTPRTVSGLLKVFGWNAWLLRSAVSLLLPNSTSSFIGKTDYVLDDYLEPDFHGDHAGYDVRGFVHVQADWQGKGPLSDVDETRWLEQVCGDELLAIVGAARLDSPDLGELLDAHTVASKRFVGVRDLLAHDADRFIMDYDSRIDRCLEETWQRGYAELGRRDLSFDLWMYGPQLEMFERVLRDHPGTRVVLDHLGTPIAYGGPYGGYGGDQASRDRIVKTWRDDMARLASYPQLHMKLSGLFMPAVGWGVHLRDEPPSVDEVVDCIGPMVEHVLEHFGVERCIFGSNFPVDKVALPWGTFYEALVQLVLARSDTERRAIFHDNAVRFYSIGKTR